MNLQKFYVVKLPLPMWNFEIFDVVNFILLRLPFYYSFATAQHDALIVNPLLEMFLQDFISTKCTKSWTL